MDSLTKELASEEELVIVAKVNRSVVARMCILEGVKILEKEYGLEGSMTPSASGAAEGSTRGRKPPKEDEDCAEKLVPLPLTIPAWLLDRALRIAEAADDCPEGTLPQGVSRSVVLRYCLRRGIPVLEERYGIEPASESRFRGIEDVPAN